MPLRDPLLPYARPCRLPDPPFSYRVEGSVQLELERRTGNAVLTFLASHPSADNPARRFPLTFVLNPLQIRALHHQLEDLAVRRRHNDNQEPKK